MLMLLKSTYYLTLFIHAFFGMIMFLIAAVRLLRAQSNGRHDKRINRAKYYNA